MILKDKTVIVVGVGSGLGAEVARLCVRDGARVALGARTEEQLKAVAEELDPSGERVLWSRTDLTQAADCEALVAAAIERFGSLDAVVQVAAFEQVFGGLHVSDFDDWRRAFDTNVLGSLQVVRAVAPAMKEHGGGSIVLIGSQSMYLPLLEQAGYAASKGALLTAMYYLAKELGPDRIRVNMVVPSWMWGPPVQGFIKHQAKHKGISAEDAKAAITSAFPLRDMAADEDVAEAVVFLASDRARMITGQTLMVNAGELMR